MHAIDVIDRRGRQHRLVLRRFIRPNWQQPELPLREANVLELLRGIILPVPRLVAVDALPEACDLPALLMTRLPGRMVLAPPDMTGWLVELARPLPAIHALRLPRRAGVQPFRPYYDARALAPPAWSSRPDAWRRVLDVAAGAAPQEPPHLIHRDYHPANVLWRRGRISGVVDWLNASVGPAAIDVAHCRRNLVMMFGIAQADRFLAAYQSLIGSSRHDYHPYWDALMLADSPGGSVFQGWTDAGLRLTERQVRARLDRFAVNIAKRC
jgi:Ser/Thr protein kinase RdoA (MazF antagonist)